MKPDLTRDRKVKVALAAMIALLLGLLACLVALVVVPDAGMAIGGLFTPYGIGVGAALRFFVDANVKVHQAQGAVSAPAGGSP